MKEKQGVEYTENDTQAPTNKKKNLKCEETSLFTMLCTVFMHLLSLFSLWRREEIKVLLLQVAIRSSLSASGPLLCDKVYYWLFSGALASRSLVPVVILV